VIIVFIAAQATDLIITMILALAFGDFTYVEANPIMRGVYEGAGIPGLLAAKSAAVMACVGLLVWANSRWLTAAAAGAAFAFVVVQVALILVAI
jgi:hypothetical protein